MNAQGGAGDLREMISVLAGFKTTFDKFLELGERLAVVGERVLDKMEHQQQLQQQQNSDGDVEDSSPTSKRARLNESIDDSSSVLSPLSEERIQVVLVDLDSRLLKYRIKPTTKLSSLMTAYAKKKNADVVKFRFCLATGQVLLSSQTSQDYGLADGDVIHVQLRDLNFTL